MLLRKATDIGPIVREARTKKGWTQTELADAAGVSRVWVSMLENGKTTVEFGLVVAAINALGYVASIKPVGGDGSQRSRVELTRGGKPLRSRLTQSRSQS